MKIKNTFFLTNIFDIFIYMYMSLGISLSFSSLNDSELFCCEFIKTFVILFVILLPIKSAVASAGFRVIRFAVVLSATVADCLV